MKRLLDLVVGIVLSLLLAPLLVLIALLVRLKLGTPVLFTQMRPGLNEKHFKVIKFRTMTNKRNAIGCLLHDEDRLTKFGILLRSTSLDELPELWNVIRGEMSLVGPRPLLVEYLPLYSKEQARRHEVKPGITGWAQVNGRNAINWSEKFNLDVWYVDNRTMWLDIKILFLTVRKVFMRDDISQADHATMKKFKGDCDARK